MHLYQRPPEVVKCPSCKKYWRTGDIRCTVLHEGDGCCHYGDAEVPEPEDSSGLEHG